jgi:hypothetical protein
MRPEVILQTYDWTLPHSILSAVLHLPVENIPWEMNNKHITYIWRDSVRIKDAWDNKKQKVMQET